MIIEKTWFTFLGKPLGAVLVKDNMEMHRGYIGIGSGMTQEMDADLILAWGAKLTLKQAQGMFDTELTKSNYIF